MIKLFVFAVILVVGLQMWYYSIPCSVFKTSPVLRLGYAPARCI